MSDKTKAFANSETKHNLMRAFAGESQARNRYTIAAGIAQKSGLAVIQGLFLFTADQEKSHAKQFYRQLADFGGENIRTDGTYPVDIYPELIQHLRAAQHNEYQEWEHDYNHFAEVAMGEGFPLVGKLFEHIAGVEKIHGDRFGRFADMLENHELFAADTKVEWMCLNCGYVVESTVAPNACPVCRHPQGYFVRVELSCFLYNVDSGGKEHPLPKAKERRLHRGQKQRPPLPEEKQVTDCRRGEQELAAGVAAVRLWRSREQERLLIPLKPPDAAGKHMLVGVSITN